MDVHISRIYGNWDAGYALDRHTVHSECLGDGTDGIPAFNTTRTEIGEALYRLKYRGDLSQTGIIGRQLHESLSGFFQAARLVVPMPPSRDRRMQPVYEIAGSLAELMGVPYCDELLVKTGSTGQLKNIGRKREKVAALKDAFTYNDVLDEGEHDVLLVDDLYDTGSSLRAATAALRSYHRIGSIFVAVVTRK